MPTFGGEIMRILDYEFFQISIIGKEQPSANIAEPS